ncbi:MAG: mechanosensitive ion channel family protein [Acidobacteriota bacterium]
MRSTPVDVSRLSVNPTTLNIVLVVLIVLGAVIFSSTARFVLSRLSERFPARRLFFKRLQPIFQIGAYGIAAYFVLTILSPNQTSMMAILGSMALAIGLAAQNLLRDLIGGVVILTDQPFQNGDHISVGDLSGEVTNVGLRSTRLLNSHNERVTIPNSRIIDGGVSNLTAGAVDCLVSTALYMPTDTDLVACEAMVRDAVATSRGVYLKKPITVLFKEEPGRNQMRLDIHAYVFDVRFQEAFATELLLRVRHALYEEAQRLAKKKAAEALTLEQVEERARHVVAEQIMALGSRFAHPGPAGVR